jgi:hypothetical protein
LKAGWPALWYFFQSINYRENQPLDIYLLIYSLPPQYIMIGIPLFLIILAKAGKLLSRGLRKLYKRMHKMKRFPEAARRMSEPMKVHNVIYY